MAAVEHALAAFQHGKHVVMVMVEADAYLRSAAGAPLQAAGVVYSPAYGDQPALICDLVDQPAPPASPSSPARARLLHCPVHTRDGGLLRPDS